MKIPLLALSFFQFSPTFMPFIHWSSSTIEASCVRSTAGYRLSLPNQVFFVPQTCPLSSLPHQSFPIRPKKMVLSIMRHHSHSSVIGRPLYSFSLFNARNGNVHIYRFTRHVVEESVQASLARHAGLRSYDCLEAFEASGLRILVCSLEAFWKNAWS